MLLPSPLHFGTLIRRYKRFLADVALDDGRTVIAHSANPGSMKTCAEPGQRVWLSENSNPKRKLRFTWEVVETAEARVYVNPVAVNRLVAEAINERRIQPLAQYDILEREVRVGERSRMDLRLRGAGADCYVEVKSATYRIAPGRCAFPDAVTSRGTRHLEELMRLRREGHRAVLFYCVSRTDAESVEPADAVDPIYGRTLREAAKAGVELMAHRVAITDGSIELGRSLPVNL
jgi:sugar fermentation stimulation protein A